ncbi:MAG: LysM peptidoglycan-binding domain-containing protein, partial [Flavobacteriales bacterium]|nr:LysM peptidoglycan-binding domain-containing protein [Flavobacteriales bacterium]
YIDQWKDEAVYQMVVNKIPASITLAQGILESGDGNSELAKRSNNHFGIKCHSDWTGSRTYHDDDKKGECFRVYSSAHESFEDHSDFLSRKRYASLFDLKITDYKGWAKGLKKCGYATDPSYAKRLISIIEANDLASFDKEALKYIKKGDLPPRGYVPTAPEVEVLAKNESKADKKAARKQKRGSDDLPPVVVNLDRTIKLSSNNIKYILTKDGDDFDQIADELEVMPWQIRKYNDFTRDHHFTAGEMVYIQPKRSMAREKWHVVEPGESMWDISQHYGVKLKKLYKKNNMTFGSEPDVGQKLSLRAQIKVPDS